MSHKQKRFVWSVLLVVVVVVGGLAFVAGRSRRLAAATERQPAIGARGSLEVQGGSAKDERDGRSGRRNLSLQPEAFKMARLLGPRFSPLKRARSMLVGTLTMGSQRRNVETIRTQTDKGEQVEVKIAGSSGSLTWDAGRGAFSSSRRATGSDLELIEKLVLDSPDQFVLAQLRGASYYTVARNVRPVEAGDSDNYTGPLWNIVRVIDPERDEEKRPSSKWRLYYINTATGLIDKVISEINGERIEAGFSAWTEQGGEKFPATITWSRQGQEIMTFRLTNVSHRPQP